MRNEMLMFVLLPYFYSANEINHSPRENVKLLDENVER